MTTSEQVERTDESSSRRLSQPERHKLIQKKVSGIDMREGAMSRQTHSSICALGPGCTKTTANGRLKQEAQHENAVADNKSLRFALRRGLALHLANILDFGIRRKWSERLLDAHGGAGTDACPGVVCADDGS